jgi:hypothetical protein
MDFEEVHLETWLIFLRFHPYTGPVYKKVPVVEGDA